MYDIIYMWIFFSKKYNRNTCNLITVSHYFWWLNEIYEYCIATIDLEYEILLDFENTQKIVEQNPIICIDYLRLAGQFSN